MASQRSGGGLERTWYMKLSAWRLVTLSRSRSPMSSAFRKNSCSRSNSYWACLFASSLFLAFSSAMNLSRWLR